MKERKRSLTPANLLLLLLALSTLSLIVSTYVTHGNNLELVYFQDYDSDRTLENIGMDLYNSMQFAEKDDYQTTSAVYPPLNYVFYGLLARSVPAIAEEHPTVDARQGSLLVTQEAIMTFLFVSMFCALLLLWVLQYLSKTVGWKMVLLSILVLTCGPILYVLERGNGVIFSAGLIGCFLLWYPNKNWALRELALICLAIGAVIKIYPVVFGLLLLREKRWGQAARSILYGIIFFLLPFAFTGGLASLNVYIASCLSDAVSQLGAYNLTGGGARIDLDNILQVIIRAFSLRGAVAARKLILVCLVVMFFFSRSKWRSVLIAAALTVLSPFFSFYYTACFYLLPMSLFLLEEEHRFTDYWYAIAFAAVLCVLPYGSADLISSEITKALPINLTLVVCNSGQLLLLLLLFLDFIRDIRVFLSTRRKKEQKIAVSAG